MHYYWVVDKLLKISTTFVELKYKQIHLDNRAYRHAFLRFMYIFIQL